MFVFMSEFLYFTFMHAVIIDFIKVWLRDKTFFTSTKNATCDIFVLKSQKVNKWMII